MRWRNRRDTQDFRASEPVPVKRDPSVPDRERIDSDVRAFMRPVSTPWIVFDRDSRIGDELAFATKAAMRAGVAFMSSPDLPPSPAPMPPVQMQMPMPMPATPTAASRLADINAMFPGSVPQQKVNEEPSSLIVAADVVPEAPKPSLIDIVPMKRSRVGLIGATLGAVGVCSIAAYVIASLQTAPAPAAAAEPPKVEAAVAAAPPPAPEPAPVVEAPAPPPAPEPAAAPAEVVGENATDPKKRWGTLTIKSKKQVWFDGKRMLGTGNRSFMVYCGMHTVAVAEKTAQKDMEVPCNGELTIDNK
jgi:hypothetical protein